MCVFRKYRFTIKYSDWRLNSLGWNSVGPASRTVAQHYISIGPMYSANWCFWRRYVKRHPDSNAAVRKHDTMLQIVQIVSMPGQLRRLWVNIETALGAQSIQQTPVMD